MIARCGGTLQAKRREPLMPERGRNDHPHSFHRDGAHESIINDATADGAKAIGVRIDADPMRAANPDPFHVDSLAVEEGMKRFRSLMEGKK
ncbi:ATP-binding protein [Geobacillus sp. Sah69]|nr:ATP-binding protein [Geobacillus sp. Sah69]